MQRITRSQEDMHAFASEIVGSLSGGEVLGLSGDLGTGKTEFVRGLAQALGSRDAVKSPSFTLLNHYRLEHPRIKHLIHVDLYRLEDVGSNLAHQIGLDEWLNRSDTVTIIEWPERLLDEIAITHRFKFRYGDQEAERVVDFPQGAVDKTRSL